MSLGYNPTQHAMISQTFFTKQANPT